MSHSVNTEKTGPIVVVDDDEVEIELFCTFKNLAKIEREVKTFLGGQDFLEYMAGVKQGTNPMPSVVLLDVRMPVLSGYEVLERIRADKLFHEIPIVLMFSNSCDEADIEHSSQSGANGYKVKPPDKESYIQFIQSLVE